VSVRTAKPRVHAGLSIEEYSSSELCALVRWVISDGQLRTDEEIVSEVARELGFQRRGVRIVAAIESAIRSTKH
jgi:hypothetical protein